MSVGRLQSKCYDCASRADSKTPESHLKSSCKPEGFLDELRSDLDSALVDICGEALIASDSERRTYGCLLYHPSRRNEQDER